MAGSSTISQTARGPLWWRNFGLEPKFSAGAHWDSIRVAAAQSVEAEPAPSSDKHEEWKYTSLQSLRDIEFVPVRDGRPESVSLDRWPALNGSGPSLVFVNGVFSPALSRLSELPADVIVSPFSECSSEDLSALGRHATFSGKLGSTNDERVVKYNSANLADGALVRLSRGVRLDAPLSVVFVTSGAAPTVSFPRVLVLAEEDSKGTLIEAHVGDAENSLALGVAEVELARRAEVTHVRFQDESLASRNVSSVFARQEAESNFTSIAATFGCQISRLDVNVWLAGSLTETRLDGVYVGVERQHLAHHTRIDHAEPHCHSFEAYKGILDGSATGVFNGKIFVYEDAQKTDAKQTNQALLLSPTATINTKPQLEIFADDVKCTHGATVGQLPADAMFYLRSRGIPFVEARNLLIYAFAAEVLERIGDQATREALEARLYQKLAESGH
ncbi:MAG: Fe-S cluster assembly protein SufD [Armatimonadetes bacterium]|nr:Fe-S cluster assembly protein SufD [Armatimonadota bacterium]NOG38959.1 Fe-S cluster assembly protein SufD [Armatimonadota bacterium]